MNSLKIHDIKPLESIPDYSLFILIALIIVLVFIMGSIIYFLRQYFKNKNSDKKQAYRTLNNLDFNHSKLSAYTITKVGKVLISNDREQKLYEELIDDLEQYKYKKEVITFNTHSKHLFKLFMDAVDVK